MKFLITTKLKPVLAKLALINSAALFISCSVFACGNSNNTSGSISSNSINVKASICTPKKPSFIQVKMISGSVKANIERIARTSGWKNVVWKSTEDYNWQGTTVIKASSFPQIMEKILTDYPLQADFYQGNHTLVIQARTLK